jgi:hypothetical protein
VSGGQCMLCTPSSQCPTTTGNCPDPFPVGGPGARADCASGTTGTAPPPAGGCCSFTTGAGNCGCVFSTTGFAGNAPNQGTPNPNAGSANNGPGCCVPGATPGSGTTCTPGAAGCVPCCNGDPIPATGATPGCCTNAATGVGLCGIT